MIFGDLINNLNNNLRYQVSLVSGTREPSHPTFFSLQTFSTALDTVDHSHYVNSLLLAAVTSQSADSLHLNGHYVSIFSSKPSLNVGTTHELEH